MTTEQTNVSKHTDSIAPGIHVVAKPIGPLCNLNCEYCFYLEKQALFSPGEKYRMSDEVLTTFITNYITSQPTPVVEDYDIAAPYKFTGEIAKIKVDVKEMSKPAHAAAEKEGAEAAKKKAMSD